MNMTGTPRPSPGQTIAGYVSELLDRAASGQLESAEAALTWDIEYELYRQAIKRADGNQVKAAKWLGVSRTTVREKLKLGDGRYIESASFSKNATQNATE